ncbi:hypothetical protein UFOVP460_17 [uncultured Caudovirales phage]|uniref:Uncharacterized protein n=1 Tax=uncultured Caudovirales phage TaxID=2100421 RepID=A0A6J5MFL2_9CAUD|nr:hypothetical protein UFOVP460_17 [uncultured Caudovirales phage]
MSPIDPSLLETAEDFKKGGWIVAVLGALGAIARLIITEERFKAIIWVRKGIAGAIVGTLVYFAINHAPIDAMYKGIIYSSSGALAPDIFEWIKRKFTKESQ